MRILLIIIIIGLHLSVSSQNSRIESEYKLVVPADIKAEIWSFLNDDGFANSLNLGTPLTTKLSEELFIDVYYDDEQMTLFNKDSGLRYRKRYVMDTLNKVLIQLKAALSEDGVARTETKYEVKKSKRKKDLVARHNLLGLMKTRDRSDIDFELAKMGTNALSMKKKLSLMQERQRVYIHDESGALATITLDMVKSQSFPYHKFTELEIELNEIRYTDADQETRLWMDDINNNLKAVLSTKFPSLKQDQTPKYNKMQNLIDNSYLSKINDHKVWLIFGGLILIAIIKLLKIR